MDWYKKLLISVRYFVLKTNKVPLFNKLYDYIYKLGLKITVFSLKRIPGVVSIYLKSGMASLFNKKNVKNYGKDDFFNDEFIFGDSDIDLTVIIKQMSANKELRFLRSFSRKYSLLKKFIPFVGEIEIFNDQEINQYVRVGCYKGYEVKRWKLIYGESSITERYQIRLEKFIIDVMGEISFWYCRFLPKILFSDNWSINGFCRLACKISKKILSCSLVSILLTDNGYNGKLLEHKVSNENNLVRLLNLIRESNYFTANAREAAIEVYIQTMYFLNEVYIHVAKLLQRGEDKENSSFWGDLKVTNYNLSPETEKYVTEALGKFVEELGKIAFIDTILLGSWDYCRNYEYKIYIILKDDLEKEMIKRYLLEVMQCYACYKKQFPFYYFIRHRYPIVLTRNMFVNILRFKLFERALEPIYIIRHGRILKGKNLKLDTFGYLVNPYGIISNLAVHFSCIRKAISFDEKLSVDDRMFSITNLIDYVCGVLPATRLILDKHIIPTTSGEALLEFNDKYLNDKYRKWLNSFYERYNGLPIDKLKTLNLKKLYNESYQFIKENLNIINEQLARIKL